MAFFEEADLPDMLSDTGHEVVWAAAPGGALTRKGLVERHTASLLEGPVLPSRDQVPSVLVERVYFEAIAPGAAITVGGEAWVVRETSLVMRSLLRLHLTEPGSDS